MNMKKSFTITAVLLCVAALGACASTASGSDAKPVTITHFAFNIWGFGEDDYVGRITLETPEAISKTVNDNVFEHNDDELLHLTGSPVIDVRNVTTVACTAPAAFTFLPGPGKSHASVWELRFYREGGNADEAVSVEWKTYKALYESGEPLSVPSPDYSERTDSLPGAGSDWFVADGTRFTIDSPGIYAVYFGYPDIFFPLTNPLIIEVREAR